MKKRGIDKGTLTGILLSVFGVVAGLWLEGGSLLQILQPTAALIVLVGTLGAILMQYPSQTVKEAALATRDVLHYRSAMTQDFLEQIIAYGNQVRRQGWMSLDSRLDQVEDVFLRKCLTLAVDGVDVENLRAAMEIDLDLYQEKDERLIGVLEAAGGFAPTLGIIGAVLGLIQVMQKMENLSEIGKGIAVAFVSTLYGIGFANLVFLPCAGRLRVRSRERQLIREMTLEAVVFMIEGISARGLRERLQGYIAAGAIHVSAEAEIQSLMQAKAELHSL
jgi:chemotaxis protein MotA